MGDFKDKKEIKVQDKIVANLVITESNNFNDSIWQKEYVLKEETDTISIGKLNIQRELEINYDDYLEVVNNFRRRYELRGDAYLQVKMFINFGRDVGNYEDVLEVIIPINEDYTYIEDNFEKNRKIKIDNHQGAINKILVILILGDILSYLWLKDKQDKEEGLLSNILKDYKYLIVKVKEAVNLSNYEIVRVIEIEDLIDIALLRQVNIIYYEEKKIFYLLIGNMAYVLEYNKTVDN